MERTTGTPTKEEGHRKVLGVWSHKDLGSNPSSTTCKLKASKEVP